MIGIDGLGNSSVLSKAVLDSGPTLAPAISPAPKGQEPLIKTSILPAQDQVTLSDQSKELSQQMQQKRSLEGLVSNDAIRSPEKLPEKKTLSAVEVVKYFPPFLSSSRRQEILEQYPEFRRQIEQMTVPRPIDFSSVDQSQPLTSAHDKKVAGN